MLQLARELKVLKVGRIAVDGTKVHANASKHAAVSYQRAGEKLVQFEAEVAELLDKAEQSDSTPLENGLTLPGEIALRRDRIEQLRLARTVLEQRAAERAQAERAEYDAKRAERSAQRQRGERVGGHEPQSPKETPQATDQYNFTDPKSRIMKAGNGSHFEQAYNAQAAVDTDSRLIVGQRVTNAPNDKQQLRPTVATIPAAVAATVREMLADSGFVSQAEISELERDGTLTVYAAVEKTSHHRRVCNLERHEDPPPPPPEAPVLEQLRY